MKPVRQDSRAIVIRHTPWHLVVLAGFCALLALGAIVRFFPERAELPSIFPLFPATLLAMAMAFASAVNVVTSRFDQDRRSLLQRRRGLFGSFSQEVPFEAIAAVRVATEHAGASQRLALEVRTRDREVLRLGTYGLGQEARLEAVAKQLRKFIGHSGKERPYRAAPEQERRARQRQRVYGIVAGLMAIACYLIAWFWGQAA